MKLSLQIGAGNIGRACVGRLLHNAGFKVIFSDVNEQLLMLLDEKQSYPVRMVGQNFDETVIINDIGILPKDPKEKEQIFQKLEMITTAVGVPILPKIAPLIAEIIDYRYNNNITTPLNIIACENAVRASSQLKNHVIALLDNDIINWMQGIIVFPDAATDSIVPTIPTEDPLLVTSENFAEIIIDKSVFLGSLSEVEGLYLKDNLDAYIERKLFTLNTGHAITAYLGINNGYTMIKEAINDTEIRETVLGAMKESGEVLILRYDFDHNEHEKYIHKIISRFENPYLDDALIRVGRDPLRKLSKDDRLIKPLLGTIEYNISHDNLIKGIKSAFQFQHKDDESSLKMQELLKQENGISIIAGLSIDNAMEKRLLEELK